MGGDVPVGPWIDWNLIVETALFFPRPTMVPNHLPSSLALLPTLISLLAS